MTKLPVVGLLTANAISMIGNVLALIAIPWYVLQTTGSAFQTGLAGAAEALPTVLAAFFGGVLVDRVGYKRISILADLTSALSIALIPLLQTTLGLAFWQLLLLIFLAALLDAPGNTARRSLLPEVAELGGMKLERANSAYQAIQRFATLLGAPLAGILIVAMGVDKVLWLDALTFAVSAALIGLTSPCLKIRAISSTGYLSQIQEGLRFIVQNRLILTVVGVITLTNFLDAPLFSVIMPVYTRQSTGNASNLGWLLSAFGGGALVGTLLFGAIGFRLPRRLCLIGAFLLMDLSFWLLAILPPLPLVLITLTLGGFFSGPINPILMTVVQERVPVPVRGRVLGLITALALAATPSGILLGGLLLENLGLSLSLLNLAIGYLIASLILLFSPALTDLKGRSAPSKIDQSLKV